MREIRRTYRIRREVSLIFRFISCKYSPMLFVIYISFYYYNSTRSFMERTSCVIRKMLVPRKRIKTVFPFTSANSFTIFSHFLSKTRNFDKSFYKLFDSNFLSL